MRRTNAALVILLILALCAAVTPCIRQTRLTAERTEQTRRAFKMVAAALDTHAGLYRGRLPPVYSVDDDGEANRR